MRVRTILPVSLAALLAAGCTAPPEQAAAPALRVATFRCDATPPPGEPLIWATPLTEALDPLLAKGVVIDDGATRYVLCTVDWCEICNGSNLAFRSAIADAAGTDPARVALHTVHQHAAPYADVDAHRFLDAAPEPPLRLSDAFLQEIAARLAGAVAESLARLEPFDQIGLGKAKVERVASTRRLVGEDGKIIVRYSGGGKDPKLAEAPEGDIDSFVRTITFAREGKPIARLHYYATHPQTFCCDGRASSDFVGLAREALEKREGVFQVYFTGCSGDVTAGKYNDGSEEARAGLKERLLAGMEASIAATRFAPAGAIEWRTAPITFPLRTDEGYTIEDWKARLANPKTAIGMRVYEAAIPLAFSERIDRPIEASLLRIGGTRILHLPGEPMLAFQRYAQELAGEDFIAVAGYGDCGPGYICTDRAYDEGGYEPTATNVGKGSEAILKGAIRTLLAGP
ncbi:MAG: hypothetical protein JXP34_23105 [Planctomycetes bacterium]|nr:hypothetical protein [Planctomycetota bacterium]